MTKQAMSKQKALQEFEFWHCDECLADTCDGCEISVAIECIEKCIEHEEKIDKIRFICNYEVGSRHEICDKILAVIDGGDNE